MMVSSLPQVVLGETDPYPERKITCIKIKVDCIAEQVNFCTSKSHLKTKTVYNGLHNVID